MYCKFLQTCIRQLFLGKPAHYNEPGLVEPRALERFLPDACPRKFAIERMSGFRLCFAWHLGRKLKRCILIVIIFVVYFGCMPCSADTSSYMDVGVSMLFAKIDPIDRLPS